VTELRKSTGVRPAVTESEVTFTSADGVVTLAGTLTGPTARHNPPAVVLVSGTGPVDRDVTFVGHALFRVLARSLARVGIASLRFDKRGVGASGGEFATAGPDDFVADVVGAVDYLVEREGFSRDRTGLVGHSEGGMVALSAAAVASPIPFCVVLAGPLLSGRDNFVRSCALMARGGFERDDRYDRLVTDLTSLLEMARTADMSEPDPHALAIADRVAPLVFSDRTAVILGTNHASGAEFLRLLASSCLATCLGWDPARIVPAVRCPVLAIYASRDVQVPARDNLAAARALLDRLGDKDWAIREMPSMNHAFQRCTTGMPDEYASIDHVMADEAVGPVAGWIALRVMG